MKVQYRHIIYIKIRPQFLETSLVRNYGYMLKSKIYSPK